MPFKIYYLDDEPELLELFVDCFSAPDRMIKIFTDHSAAIAAIQELSPDLLILDYRLPNTTGDHVAMSVNAEIAKILITGDLEVVPKAHFLKIFRKPYNLNELQDFIKIRQKNC